MDIETPKGWRKGQAIFNFLAWLHKEKNYALEFDRETGRMADCFHIPDSKFDKLYDEFLELHKYRD